jgi:hypothetical protein
MTIVSSILGPLMVFNYRFKDNVKRSDYYVQSAQVDLAAVFTSSGPGIIIGGLLKVGPRTPGRVAGAVTSRVQLKYRMDLFLKLLIPAARFMVFKKRGGSVNFFFFDMVLWPGEFLDLLALMLYSNPIFLNSKYFDTSGFVRSGLAGASVFLYYIFKIPLFSAWLVLFIPGGMPGSGRGSAKIISVESLFRGAAWAEREFSELFGFFFLLKSNNRKLITDYFFKVFPMLKWVPSIGFSELYVSSEGFFFTRPVKVFNGSLS